MENKDLQFTTEDAFEVMQCTFKDIKECGHYQQCTNLVRKNKMDKNNGNNNYCSPHQKFVNEINTKRTEEAIKKMKENINKYIENVKKCHPGTFVLDLEHFQKSLNNGDFDE
ncbi:hypothetical protein LT336_00746 [Spiroplasma sp. JKS002671]|nr:hypothetical protein [Spiroplasma sp. JKS002671]MCL8210994.1 hypothetical protein [Spiroplasma sp. JKS002671]